MTVGFLNSYGLSLLDDERLELACQRSQNRLISYHHNPEQTLMKPVAAPKSGPVGSYPEMHTETGSCMKQLSCKADVEAEDLGLVESLFCQRHREV